ncbi:restriction endonuclease subunit S [Paenibacillus sp. IB182493]|uniref:Restriction endonuclease subunit S n=1 Tax=Paenibacillus arenilitoris TaxID=2772299 RepID=A0A927H8F5_9BACL|nr:restriction endonuclease subunit S [Paenibacillus arenilitoris]
MTREQSYLRMLKSTVNMQWNIASILDAKAAETEKMKNWYLNHIHAEVFDSHQKQLGQSLQLHEQVIEMIDGITKLNMGIVSVMRAVLKENEDEDEVEV